MKKHVKMLIVLFSIVFISTGCGSTELTKMISTTLPKVLHERAQQNINIAETLCKDGIIDTTTRDKIINNIQGQVDKIAGPIRAEDEDFSESDITKVGAIAQSCRFCWVYGRGTVSHVSYKLDDGTVCLVGVVGGDCKADNPTVQYLIGSVNMKKPDDAIKCLSAYLLGNYIATQTNLNNPNLKNMDHPDKTADNEDTTGKNTFKGEDNGGQIDMSDTNLIHFIDTQMINDINEAFRIPVYVLDADKMGNVDEYNKKLQDIKHLLTEGTTDQKRNLAQYFSPMEENGKKVLLLNEDDKVIDVTEDNGDYDNNTYTQDSTTNEMGKDIVVFQDVDSQGVCKDCGDKKEGRQTLPMIAIKLVEFNPEVISKIMNLSTDGNNSCKYVIAPNENGDPVAYLVEYPITYMDSMKKTTTKKDNKDTTVIDVQFNTSTELTVNLKTGKLSRNGAVQDDTNSYLISCFDESEEKLNNQSFKIKGKIEYEVSINGTKIKTEIPRILLVDYLEATWAPGATDYKDENLVVFGRKIRFRTDEFWVEDTEEKDGKTTVKNYKLQYDLNSDIAYFTDIDGNKVSTLINLKVTDFCDIDSLVRDTTDREHGDVEYHEELDKKDSESNWWYYTVKTFAEPNMQLTETEAQIKDEESPDISELAHSNKAAKIKLATKFPGDYIGKIDKSNASPEVQLFYCVATTKGLFDSALFSDWINSEESKESLEWWNSYLSEHKYLYTVGHDKVNEFLASNYAYELSQSGMIILDLKTISKIQQIFDKDEKQQGAAWMRAVFMAIGIFLIAYSMILVLCWVIDAHLDMGFSLLNKATLGHWTAISDDEDIPDYIGGDKSYITGQRIIVRSVILIVIAIVLIRVNVMEVVLILVKTFGQLASEAWAKIKG